MFFLKHGFYTNFCTTLFIGQALRQPTHRSSLLKMFCCLSTPSFYKAKDSHKYFGIFVRQYLLVSMPYYTIMQRILTNILEYCFRNICCFQPLAINLRSHMCQYMGRSRSGIYMCVHT